MSELTDLGRVDEVTREDVAVLSRDIADEIAEIQAAWPAFEAALDSLRGSHMFALVYEGRNVYRLCSQQLERDMDNALGLDETVIPGGRYLRLRLRGTPPAIYEQIGPAMELLLGRADRDPARPLIEHYKREDVVDCLVPIR